MQWKYLILDFYSTATYLTISVYLSTADPGVSSCNWDSESVELILLQEQYSPAMMIVAGSI